MRRAALAAGSLAVVLLGCATFTSTQLETQQDGSKRETTINIATVFDAHADLAKLRASTTDKSQTTTIGALNQESTATNLVILMQYLIEASMRAGAAAAKP